MSSTRDCPFCNGKDRILKDNKLAFVILSNPRKVTGHFLVIPKRHVEKPWHLTKAEVVAIFELVLFTQKRIIENLSAGCDVRQNYRPFMVQDNIKVDHVHYHVMPRDNKDNIYKMIEKDETQLFQPLTKSEHDKIAKILE